jgi:hypothetical protein
VADTEAERIRKAAYRASKKQTESVPVLPAPLAQPGKPIAPAGNPAGQVPGGPSANGMAPVSAAPGELLAPIVLWTAPDLTPLTDAAVPLMEEVLHTQKLQKLRAAKIDDKLIKEIDRDLQWPDKSKQLLSKSGAALGAKYLNKIGVSAAYKDEVNFGMALLVILKMEASTNRRLDKLIAAAEKAAAPAQTAPASRTASPPLPGQAVPAAASSPGLFPTDVEPDATKPTSKK